MLDGISPSHSPPPHSTQPQQHHAAPPEMQVQVPKEAQEAVLTASSTSPPVVASPAPSVAVLAATTPAAPPAGSGEEHTGRVAPEPNMPALQNASVDLFGTSTDGEAAPRSSWTHWNSEAQEFVPVSPSLQREQCVQAAAHRTRCRSPRKRRKQY